MRKPQPIELEFVLMLMLMVVPLIWYSMRLLFAVFG
jgi:hypothetical protein